MRAVTALMAAVGMVCIVGAASPARAHDDWNGWQRQEWREHQWREQRRQEWRENEWREQEAREHREHEWRERARQAYAPPPAYYAPPAAYYAPPPAYYPAPRVFEAPGLSIEFGIR